MNSYKQGRHEQDGRKKVVIYGNCHTEIISLMLESYSGFGREYVIIPTKRIQDIKDPRELYNDSYGQCDIFIHQSIRLNNRYGEEYASEKIISRLKNECRVISIPNVYHLPLCFFPQYSDAPELRKDGVTYFFRDSIIDSHKQWSFNAFKSIIEDYKNENLFDEKSIVASFESFIEKVRKREDEWDIKVSQFILDNYQSHHLFYDPNHPTNYFLSYIASELLKMLLKAPDIENEQLNICRCLDSIEMPICSSVKRALQLNWTNDTIRNSKPNTNKLQKGMTLNNYTYQYMSSMWIVNDSPGGIRRISHFFWRINSFVFILRKQQSRAKAVLNHIFRKF